MKQSYETKWEYYYDFFLSIPKQNFPTNKELAYFMFEAGKHEALRDSTEYNSQISGTGKH